MNLFVTGGAGYIGSVYVERAIDAGHRVTVLDNLSEGHRDAVDSRAAFVEADLAGEAATLAVVIAGVSALSHSHLIVGEQETPPGPPAGYPPHTHRERARR